MANNTITTCIIPAAGKGSRWAPVSGYLPKEMLPLIDKPVIEWCIDEAVHSGCNHIIIVINSQKNLIKSYLQKAKKYHNKIRFDFVYQKYPRGITHAIWLCKNLINNKAFCVALPDLPVISKKPALKQLIEAYNKNESHIISFDKFSKEHLHLYGECLVEKQSKVLNVQHFCAKISKKYPHHINSKIRMSGRFIFTNEIFPIISELIQKKSKQEITDVDALHKALNHNQLVKGLKIIGHTYDTGNPKSYVRANTAFFKKYVI